MQKKFSKALLAALGLAVLPVAGFAQIEKRPSDVLRADQQALPSLLKETKGTLAAHLKRVQAKKDPKTVSNAVRAAKDVSGKTVGDFIFYSVPAMSENQYLPDAYPVDGIAMKQGQIVMAADEFEPCSFLIYPLKDLGKVQLSLSEFKTKDGKVFPASALNLKTVKVWYQNHNAWSNYFGDTELRLVPELLLNDENLIFSDTKKVQNYARLTEENGRVHYHWISPPEKMDTRVDDHYRTNSTFLPMKKNFRDAKTLQPVQLNEGEFKQFFLTAHAAKNQAAGIYRGSVRLTDAKGAKLGEVPVAIRVLPFVLPAPKTYFDVKKDFLSGSYSYLSIPLICIENGGDEPLAWKQLEAILRDQAEHGQTLHWMRDTGGGPGNWEFLGLLETFKKAGMSTNPIIGVHPEGGPSGWKTDAKLKREWMLKNLGHTNAIMLYGDEPGAEWVMNQRPVYKVYQEQGFKFIIAGQENVLFKAGYVYDFFNMACDPAFNRGKTRRWNEIGHANVAWYAGQHVGPENPAFNRRQYGLGAYLANFSANFNYAHHLGPYNDRSQGYRPMVFAYGCYDGVIDTLQWEGFREGIDDIRYATLLKTLALEAAESKDIDTVYAGRQALQYMALCQPDAVDLNTARYEMIDRILQLKKMLKK